MPIELDPETRTQALASIQRFAREELDLDLGDLKADTVLRYFLAELGPVAYNRGVAGAQRYVQERLLDLDGACHEEPFGFWKPAGAKPRRGR
jgi:uncharacterized protein (DUF2164 family)